MKEKKNYLCQMFNAAQCNRRHEHETCALWASSCILGRGTRCIAEINAGTKPTKIGALQNNKVGWGRHKIHTSRYANNTLTLPPDAMIRFGSSKPRLTIPTMLLTREPCSSLRWLPMMRVKFSSSPARLMRYTCLTRTDVVARWLDSTSSRISPPYAKTKKKKKKTSRNKLQTW